jgi:hypothetical protein
VTVATVGHVAHTQLLLVPTAMTSHMTSDDHCYCGACGTLTVSTGPHSSDRLSNISGPLLLPPTVATGYMTSDDCCYCWARGMQAVATSPYSNDGLAVHYYWTASSDGLLVRCYWTTSSNGLAVHCYWTASSDRLSSAIPSLSDCALAMS